MFEYIRGEVISKQPTHVVLDVQGIGYRIQVPVTTYRSLPDRGPATVWTYARLSEDDLRLFGFATERERDVFRLIVDSVPQLGPARALTVFSSISGEELFQAVQRGDAAQLKRIKGIGDKLATRMIVELRGKLPTASAAQSSSIVNEAVLALLALGYTRPEAEAAVEKARKEAREAPLEELIRRSLQHA